MSTVSEDKIDTASVLSRDKNADASSYAQSTANSEEQIQQFDEPVRRVNTTKSDTDAMTRTLSRVYTSSSAYKTPLPVMGGNRPHPAKLTNEKDFEVEFDGDDDPLLPLNWSMARKLKVGLSVVWPTTVLSWGSSIYGNAAPALEAKYHVGTPVAVLGVSLYVIGFATGPIVFGPMSEIYGRKVPMLISSVLFTAFTFWCATADHFYHLMLYRFFSAALGAAPLVVAAAALADILRTDVRGVGITLFALCVIAGPMIAPVVGGYIANSYLGYRWVFYITGIMGATGILVIVFIFEETFHPVVLCKKANELRERTGNQFIYAPQERVRPDFKTIGEKVLVLPIKMLFMEPILFSLSLYHGFIYGILYLCLEAIPLIFTEKYHWHKGNVMLPYLGMFVGALLGNLASIFIFEPQFKKDLAKSGKPVLPEARLPLMMVGAFIFPAGIFLLCWTGNYHVHWIAPVIGCALVGFGMNSLFLPIFNYIIDSYLFLAASALAANTFLRSSMGAAFPIFATAMFHNLGVQWAGTLLGCLAVLLLPIPFLFYIFGARIRKLSKYAVDLEHSQD